MNQADPWLMLLRLSAGGTEGGQTKAARLAASETNAVPGNALPPGLEHSTESELFAGILEILARAGETFVQSNSGEKLLAVAEGESDRPLEPVLNLVKEMDIDLDAVAGPFSFVRLPVLGRDEAHTQQLPYLSVQTKPAARLLLAEDTVQLTQAARTFVQTRTPQGAETVLPQVVLPGEDNGMTPVPTPVHTGNQMTQTTTSPQAVSAEPPLKPGHSEWPSAFAARIVWLVEGGRERADLRLEPPNLGQLTVRVRLEGDQASLSFHSQHGMVRDVVEGALPRLRELMADAGYTLAEVDIGTGDSNGHGDEAYAGTAGAEGGAVSDHDTDDQKTDSPVVAGNRLFDAYA